MKRLRPVPLFLLLAFVSPVWAQNDAPLTPAQKDAQYRQMWSVVGATLAAGAAGYAARRILSRSEPGND